MTQDYPTSRDSSQSDLKTQLQPRTLEELKVDELHLKFRSIISLISAVLKHKGGPHPALNDDVTQPNVDHAVEPVTQRALDALATIFVRDYEVVAVAMETKQRGDIDLIVTAQFENPLPPQPSASSPPRSPPRLTSPCSMTNYLLTPNPRYKDGNRRNGKNRKDPHGWEKFRFLKPTSEVKWLDVNRPCLYALQLCLRKMYVLFIHHFSSTFVLNTLQG